LIAVMLAFYDCINRQRAADYHDHLNSWSSHRVEPASEPHR
jgi:hypothetical protein